MKHVPLSDEGWSRFPMFRCAPGGARTPDLRIRSPIAEALRAALLSLSCLICLADTLAWTCSALVRLPATVKRWSTFLDGRR